MQTLHLLFGYQLDGIINVKVSHKSLARHGAPTRVGSCFGGIYYMYGILPDVRRNIRLMNNNKVSDLFGHINIMVNIY